MLLSDSDISDAYWAEEIDIDPYDPKYCQPASYDVHLGAKILVPVEDRMSRGIDVAAIPQGDEGKVWSDITLYPRDDHRQWYLPPGSIALGHTLEKLTLNKDAPIAADIAGCSSLGRWFLFVHVTAGFIDPGWDGQLTLELYNASPWWIRLWEGMRIAQLRFYRMERPSQATYAQKGHYHGSEGAVPGRYYG